MKNIKKGDNSREGKIKTEEYKPRHEITEINETIPGSLQIENGELRKSNSNSETIFQVHKEDEINEKNYCSDDSETEEPVNLDEATHTDVTNATLLAQV